MPTATPPSAQPPADPARQSAVASLSPQQVELVRQAQQRRRPIDRAAGIAAFDAWCTAIFAAFSLALTLLSYKALIVGLALAAIATVGFIGRARLVRLDPAAPRLLGFNQLAFFTLITLYCIWAVIYALTHPLDLTPYLGHDAELDAMLAELDVQKLYVMLAIVVYSAVILGSAAFQGSLAIYYFTRSGPLDAYLRDFCAANPADSPAVP